MKEKLIRLLLKYKIIKYNFKQPIGFKSGIRSPIYGDFRACPSYPELFAVVTEMFTESVQGLGIQIVEGISEGAIAYGAAVGIKMQLASSFVRKDAKPKEYGLGKKIEGLDVSGQTIALLEDLVSTAGSLLEKAAIVKDGGAKVIYLRSIFSYEMEKSKKAFAQSGFNFEPLITIHDLLPYLKEELSPADYLSLCDWVREPEGWFDRHKLEFEFGFISNLREHASIRKSLVCFGLDPVIAALPDEDREYGIVGYGQFMTDLFAELNSKQLYPGMLKPNHGFYEFYDAPRQGTFAGSLTLNHVMNKATNYLYNVPINLDFKRGDIGKSSANYGAVGFDNWKVNAVTVHGYMGTDSVEPFTKYCNHANGKGVYILCKTSNPGSKDIQMQKLSNWTYLYEAMGEKIITWAQKKPGVGAVIGGTSIEELFILAKMFAGKDIPILIPGVGAQGGSASEVTQILREAGFELALARINSSSGLSHPWYSEKNPGKAIPSKNECIDMCVNALKELNEQIEYKPALLQVA